MLRFCLIASLTATAALLCSCGKREEPAPAPSPAAADTRRAIVCFGDSIAAGFGLDAGQSFPDLLQQDLDRRTLRYRVVNLGVSGDTTQDGLARVFMALAEKPSVVVLELGGNDGLRGIPLSITQANLGQMIEQFQGAGARVVLAGMSLPPNYGPAMRAVVRDGTSERIGSASQYVQVPDTRKGQLAVSGIFLKQAPQELVNPKVLQPSADGKEGRVDAWSEGGPAVRRYRPGQGIVYAYVVINPKLKGPAKEFRVGSQLRVFRNGKLFYTGAYSHTLSKSEPDPTRLVGGGVLSLGSQLSPGEYLMQVVVTDENAGKKKPPVAQWVDFEVVDVRDSL